MHAAGKIDFEKLLLDKNIKAVIFDLDGTLVDNNPFHLQTWLQYVKQHGIDISEAEYKAHINGRTNEDAIQYIFGRKMSAEEITFHTREKEKLYRELYAPYIQPVRGLEALLEFLSRKNISMAIATSGIQPNIDFMFEYIPIRHYFSTIVNSAHVQKGKPDPEIYLLTAERLNVTPNHSLVFEDALPGIASAKSAGMYVIALDTTHSRDEIQSADMVINDFSELMNDQMINNN